MSRTPLSTALDDVELPLAHVGADRRYAYVNRSYARSFGRPSAELVGRHVDELWGEAAEAHVDAVLAGECADFELHVAASDGAERQAYIRCAPQRDEGGAVAGFLVVVCSPSERERRLRALEQHIDDALFFRSSNGSASELVYMSPAFERIFGSSVVSVMNRPETMVDAVMPEDRGRAREALLGAGSHDVTVRIARPDGGTRWVRVRVQPASTDGAAAGVISDVSAIKEAERARDGVLDRIATAAMEERRRIARELHDDASQILGTLLIELAELEEAPAAAGVAERVRELTETAERAMNAVSDAARGLHPRLVDELGLPAALETHAESVGRTHHLHVDLHVEGLQETELPAPVAATLFRIVQEALTNVVKHAEAQSVAVVVRRDAERIHTVVEDDGRGFDVSAPARGLGLLGIQERVKLMGGTVVVESNPGDGTTVVVRMPVPEAGA